MKEEIEHGWPREKITEDFTITPENKPSTLKHELQNVVPYPPETQMESRTHSSNPNSNVNYNKNAKLNTMNLSRNGNNRSTTIQACAVCKYQRRKCTPDCILAPYFPHDRQRQFLNAHKLFGVSNITKIIKHLEPFQKDEAMRSIIYQSDVRACDPVGGCYRIIRELQTQIEYHKAELELVLQQLALVKSQAHHHQKLYVTEPTNAAASSTVINMNVGGDDMLNADALSLYNYPYSQQQEPPQDPFQMAMTTHDLSNSNCSVQEDSSNSWVVQNVTAMSALSLHGNNEFESKALLEIPSDHRNDLFRFDLEELAERRLCSEEAVL